MKVLVFSEILTSRVKYVFHFIFKELLGVDVIFANGQEAYSQWAGVRILYAKQPHDQEGVFFPAHGLLFQEDLGPVDFLDVQQDGEGFPFTMPETDFSFDPFSAAFYLLTRYEEILDHNTDALGRFPARESLAWRMGFLHKPVIHTWAERIAQRIEKVYPGFSWQLPAYHFKPSYDIDVAYAYRGRSWLHTSGTLFRDAIKGKAALVRERLRVISGNQQDPYDAYAYLEACMEQYHLDPVFFFLVGSRSARDHNLRYNSQIMNGLIRAIGQKWQVGLHPSTLSAEIPGRLAEEKRRLEKIYGNTINKSRQHFLLLNMPSTYALLEDAGITDDFTMGYADLTGYRAGVSIPFPYFDLTRNQVTGIMVHPFTVMDGTLNHYLKFSPEEAMQHLDSMIAIARRWGGSFMSLWHNSSLSEINEWKGWKAVHDYLLQQAT